MTATLICLGRAMRILFLVACTAALSACTFSEGDSKTEEARNGQEGDNAIFTLSFGSGQGTVDNKTFQGPSLRDDAKSFSMNGVTLYPGSKVIGQQVNFGGSGGSTMRLSFESPATAATVRNWLQPRLTKAGYSLGVTKVGLRGTDSKHRPFEILLTDTDGLTKGEVIAGR